MARVAVLWSFGSLLNVELYSYTDDIQRNPTGPKRWRQGSPVIHHSPVPSLCLSVLLRLMKVKCYDGLFSLLVIVITLNIFLTKS